MHFKINVKEIETIAAKKKEIVTDTIKSTGGKRIN